jgi:hypothetical protein
MRQPRYLAVIVACLALSACGESTLDTGNIEDEIAPQLAEEYGTKDADVSCPDDIEAKEGEEFDCDVTAPGGVEAKVTVTQEDDEGNVTWEPVQP